MRNTRQPRSCNVAVTVTSRSRFFASFFSQNSAFVAGIGACFGLGQPSTTALGEIRESNP